MRTIQRLKLQARLKRERVQDFCRQHELSVESAFRVASHRVYEEDVLQEPPRFDPNAELTLWQQALQLAKDALRLQYKSVADDFDSQFRAGWWECPSMVGALERERQEHRKRTESGVSESDEFDQWLRRFLARCSKNASSGDVRV
jgi:hypothetical protein